MVIGAERRRANSDFQRLRVPISVRPRHSYVVGELALLIVDFVIDGCWRHVIDNPFGTALPEPAPA